MAIAVFTVYKRIVVDKILIACIVWRIYIYHVTSVPLKRDDLNISY